jgi:two-component sensor histidine kinase
MSTIYYSLRSGRTNRPDAIAAPNYAASRELLVTELQHRIRNVLSVVQCLVNNTRANTAEAYRDALTRRLATLSEGYRLIEDCQQEGVSIDSLLDRTLKVHAETSLDRIQLAGPTVALEPRLALSLHMIFHELATNACKHGALRLPTGVVEVHWDIVSGDLSQVLAIQWRERGVSAVKGPGRNGLGFRLIAKALPESKVKIDFGSDGLVCRLLVDVDPSLPA